MQNEWRLDRGFMFEQCLDGGGGCPEWITRLKSKVFSLERL